jgi:alkyldihydroxyacetonephosphate synthase
MKLITYMSEKGAAPPAFVDSARNIVGPDNVSQRECDLISYSLDYWLYGILLSKDGKLPSFPSTIISPGTTGEVQEVLRLANHFRVPVTPFGGGSGVLGGAVPVGGEVVLNLQRMNKFISLDETSMVAEAEAGIIGANLERELNHRGYAMGNIPQSLYCSTLGGWIATRAVGQFSTKYGKIEDMVLGMEVVLPTGDLLKVKPVPRRSVGPSLMELFLGSEGTMGIVTKAVVAVHPLPESTVKESFVLDSVGAALDVVRMVMRAEARPAVVRIFDDSESERYFPDIGRRVTVIFIIEGEKDLVARDTEVVRRIAAEGGGEARGETPVDIWLRKRFDIGLGPVIMQHGGVVDTIEVVSLFKDARALYDDMVASMKAIEGALEVSGHFSHFYKEGACLYITFAGLPKDAHKYYLDTWNAAMEATLRHNGSISHHHGIGFWRTRYMNRELGESGADLLRRLRQAADPNSIMNRGKVIDAG